MAQMPARPPPLPHFSHSNRTEKQREPQPRQRPEPSLATEPPPATPTPQVRSSAAPAPAPAAFQGRMDTGGMNQHLILGRGRDVIWKGHSIDVACRKGWESGGTAGSQGAGVNLRSIPEGCGK